MADRHHYEDDPDADIDLGYIDLGQHDTEDPLMTDPTDLLRRAAKIARADEDPRWHPVADWLDTEARTAARTALKLDLGLIRTNPHGPALAVARALTGEDS
jgi:hypothetical protein